MHTYLPTYLDTSTRIHAPRNHFLANQLRAVPIPKARQPSDLRTGKDMAGFLQLNLCFGPTVRSRSHQSQILCPCFRET